MTDTSPNTRLRRILIVTAGLYLGGAERLLVSLVNHFDQFETVIATLDDENPLAPNIKPGAAELVVIARRWRYDLTPAARLRQVIRVRGIDAVLCFGMYEFAYLNMAMRGLARKPAVAISIHSLRLADRKQHLQHWLYARLLKGSERIIAVCDAQADYWSSAYAIPRDRFTTIYNGVDVRWFCPSGNPGNRHMIRQRYGIPEAAPVIVMVANLRPGKRQLDAIQALSLVPDWPMAAGSYSPYLMLLGDGAPEYEHEMRSLAARLRIEERVILCGAQDDVRPFLEAADAFTLTSSSEAFSVAALEAMAMGLPAVLTDVGGAGELVRPGLNGYLVPVGSSRDIAAGWQKALFGSELMDREGIRRSVVENFALDDCVRSFERVLELPPRTGRPRNQAQPEPPAAEMASRTAAQIEIGLLRGKGD